MPRELLDLRNRIFDNLMRQSSSKYSNHKDVYGAMSWIKKKQKKS